MLADTKRRMKASLVLLAIGACLLGGVGCASAGSSSAGSETHKPTAAQRKHHRHKTKRQRKAARHRAKEQRKAARHRAKKRARLAAAHQRAHRRHRLEVRQEHQEEAEARKIALVEEREQRQAAEAAPAEESSECDPNYSGACLDPNASDYDCEGGSGNGPDYTGEVTVVGEDHYELDADGDGIGCEAE